MTTLEAIALFVGTCLVWVIPLIALWWEHRKMNRARKEDNEWWAQVWRGRVEALRLAQNYPVGSPQREGLMQGVLGSIEAEREVRGDDHETA